AGRTMWLRQCYPDPVSLVSRSLRRFGGLRPLVGRWTVGPRLAKQLEFTVELVKLFVRQILQLEVDRLCVPVLHVLNQEHDQKSHDRGPRIDHELPGIGISKYRPGDGP